MQFGDLHLRHQFLEKAGWMLLLIILLLHLHLSQKVHLLLLDRKMKRTFRHPLHQLDRCSVIFAHCLFTGAPSVERISVVKMISGTINMKSTMSANNFFETTKFLSENHCLRTTKVLSENHFLETTKALSENHFLET